MPFASPITSRIHAQHLFCSLTSTLRRITALLVMSKCALRSVRTENLYWFCNFVHGGFNAIDFDSVGCQVAAAKLRRFDKICAPACTLWWKPPTPSASFRLLAFAVFLITHGLVSAQQSGESRWIWTLTARHSDASGKKKRSAELCTWLHLCCL